MDVTLTLKAEFQDHLDAVHEIDVHPDGRLFFARSNQMLILYDLAECRKLRGFYGSAGYDAAAFTSDGGTLLYMTEDRLHHWDLAGWRERMVVTGELFESRNSDVHADAGLWADGDERGVILVRKLGMGEDEPPEFSLEGHQSYIECVRFHPSGKLLASGSADKTIRFWDIKERGQISSQEAHDDFVTALAFSPNGSIMISGDYSGRLKVWELRLS